LDIPCEKVDGNDVLAVHTSAGQLISQVRDGQGPRLLHAITYRVKGHVSVDLAAYRDPAELQAALLTDPIARARERYLSSPGCQAQVLDAIEREAQAEVDTALAVAHAAAWPLASAAYTDVQTLGDGQWL
jgi:pyruvate dehydrogenase E1 component alpha subunit